MRAFLFLLITAFTLLLFHAGANESDLPVSIFKKLNPEEMEGFSARPVSGDPPPDGLRYWMRPLRLLPWHGSYVSVINRGTAGTPRWEKWKNTWGDDSKSRGMQVRRGPDFLNLGTPVNVFSGDIIDDVFIPSAPGSLFPRHPPVLSPKRAFTRPYVLFDPEIGYVVLACVCPDYLPGSVSLMPALLTSPTGQPGTWIYRGVLKGEPRTEQKKLGHPVWSDGGTLLRMPDQSWRIYLNNFGGASISLLTARKLDGPWKFLRNGDGAIRDLLPREKEGKARSNCFPHVLRVSDNEWHLWYSDAWPVQSIWHWVSRDGLSWTTYGRQPEITRAIVNGHDIKCLRTCLSPDGKTINGFLSVWNEEANEDNKGWELHLITLPAGFSP